MSYKKFLAVLSHLVFMGQQHEITDKIFRLSVLFLASTTFYLSQVASAQVSTFKIAFIRDGNIWTVGNSGGEEMKLTNLTDKVGLNTERAVWVSNNIIAYSRGGEGGKESLEVIFIDAKSGSELKRQRFAIKQYETFGYSLFSLSPDKKIFAFLGFLPGGLKAVYTATDEDPYLRPLILKISQDEWFKIERREPTYLNWFLSSNKILFIAANTCEGSQETSSFAYPYPMLVLANIDKGFRIKDLQVLYGREKTYFASFCKLSPNENEVLILTSRGLEKFNLATRKKVLLIQEESVYDFLAFDWSPDGKKVVFTKQDEERKENDIWIIDVDSKRMQKIVNNGEMPVCSPK